MACLRGGLLHDERSDRSAPSASGGIGVLSGLTGTGGGVLLSPAIVFLGWAGPRHMAGIAAPFIMANSAAALATTTWRVSALPTELPLLMAAVVAGALLGTWLGIRQLSPQALLTTLAVIRGLAAIKLLLVA